MNDKIRQLVKKQVLIPLIRGKYVVSPFKSKQEISTELIANHLYGPSYVSYESALSYFGIIPERIYTIKSATTKRKKNYHTTLGNFMYVTVPNQYYSIGVQSVYD